MATTDCFLPAEVRQLKCKVIEWFIKKFSFQAIKTIFVHAGRKQMLWSKKSMYLEEPYDKEIDFESAILEVKQELFGINRIYLDLKRIIGKQGKTRNIPDGYLIDLASKKEPKLYLVENELAKHDPLKHIAVQILNFSLSYETSPQKVKTVIKEGLKKDHEAMRIFSAYASENNYDNVDHLIESIIYKDDSFNALVIIDEMPDELENILISKFKFPVEILTLRRYATSDGGRLYEFEPFLQDVTEGGQIHNGGRKKPIPRVDISEIDTIVVPAHEDGFQDTFIGEDCWYSIRIHSSMIPKIKFIAAYRVAPVSAITHFAPVKDIKQWKDSGSVQSFSHFLFLSSSFPVAAAVRSDLCI